MPAFDFWDIDDILAEQYDVTVTTEINIIGGGMLLPSGYGRQKDLPPNSKVQVPLYLGQALVRRNSAVLVCPHDFQGTAQESLAADPITCTLNTKSIYFYEVGLRIAHLLKLEALVQDLFRAVQQRTAEIVDLSGTMGEPTNLTLTRYNEARVVFRTTFTHVEQEIYAGQFEAERHFKGWIDRFGGFKMKASHLIDAPSSKRMRMGA
mmetsp:Transcript_98191/g.204817  ORF Transcript_98191/g.204817 Transcript_98191/m.204817 type:complete len:207 (-) Transcript_98191:31-651(-)